MAQNDGHLQHRYDRVAFAAVDNATHWTTPVQIGNQTLNLLIDTGSADLWVYGLDVKDPGGHRVYDHRDAFGGPPETHYAYRGATPVNQTFDISYGFNDSRVQGFVVIDKVSVAATPPLPVAIEVATEVSDTMKSINVDGILGLAFRDLNRGKIHGHLRVVIQYGRKGKNDLS
ncbi:MAG: hypothetical protein Q9213_007438 [Squamulea squamosa]